MSNHHHQSHHQLQVRHSRCEPQAQRLRGLYRWWIQEAFRTSEVRVSYNRHLICSAAKVSQNLTLLFMIIARISLQQPRKHSGRNCFCLPILLLSMGQFVDAPRNLHWIISKYVFSMASVKKCSEAGRQQMQTDFVEYTTQMSGVAPVKYGHYRSCFAKGIRTRLTP